jgi:hypothetical protein
MGCLRYHHTSINCEPLVVIHINDLNFNPNPVFDEVRVVSEGNEIQHLLSPIKALSTH